MECVCARPKSMRHLMQFYYWCLKTKGCGIFEGNYILINYISSRPTSRDKDNTAEILLLRIYQGVQHRKKNMHWMCGMAHNSQNALPIEPEQYERREKKLKQNSLMLGAKLLIK